MIAIADDLRPEFADMAALAASMVEALRHEMHSQGWRGAEISDADYDDSRKVPSLLIIIRPGKDELTVERVSAFVKEKRAQARDAA
ncbi:hypothetical protein [uncultured Nitratireductor sp.]|uniref:hypothetical protein n=1 Tax=uncultured Nitratireductor sp. TaxID=520953 RepID=UPI0025DEDB05|nr:hypothetical protein [uncultured Nitratireductor sp.]